ncbi:hypothetical protein ACU686_13225 [Yinghuangia aomiensis]
MSEIERIRELAAAAISGAAAIQRLQDEYDDVGWRIQEPSWAKARHLLYHLLSATTELALLVEEVEHAEERGEAVSSDDFNKVLAEHSGISAHLLFHAAQIANMSGADLGKELVRLHAGNAKRFAPDSAFGQLEID